LPHLSVTFCKFWHVHRCFQLLNVPKFTKIVPKSATIFYKLNPKLRLKRKPQRLLELADYQLKTVAKRASAAAKIMRAAMTKHLDVERF